MEQEKRKYKRPNKQNFIKVFVNTENKGVITGKAKTAGLSASRYLLTAGLNLRIRPPLPAIVIKDINGWSRNLNQLSFHANSGRFDANEMKQLKLQAEEIIKLLRREK